jgi:hypothetical protein
VLESLNKLELGDTFESHSYSLGPRQRRLIRAYKPLYKGGWRVSSFTSASLCRDKSLLLCVGYGGLAG